MGENKFMPSPEGKRPETSEEDAIETNPNEVLQFIENIMHQCNVRGANDSEISELTKIKDTFSYGKISALEAKQAAQNILDSKQDYH